MTPNTVTEASNAADFRPDLTKGTAAERLALGPRRGFEGSHRPYPPPHWNLNGRSQGRRAWWQSEGEGKTRGADLTWAECVAEDAEGQHGRSPHSAAVLRPCGSVRVDPARTLGRLGALGELSADAEAWLAPACPPTIQPAYATADSAGERGEEGAAVPGCNTRTRADTSPPSAPGP